MDQDELDPCPFCGMTQLHLVEIEGFPISVFCENCHAMGPDYDERSRDDAVKAWNSRD